MRSVPTGVFGIHAHPLPLSPHSPVNPAIFNTNGAAPLISNIRPLTGEDRFSVPPPPRPCTDRARSARAEQRLREGVAEELQRQRLSEGLKARIDSLFGDAGRAAGNAVNSARRFLALDYADDRTRVAQSAGLVAVAGAGLASCAGGEPASSELQGVIFNALFNNVVGGLGLFMIGLKLMSDGLKAGSGATLKKVLRTLTTNRFSSLGVGTGVTGVIQSSSVTSVMTVGLVDAGLINFRQALGVIFGSNVGTTVTGWLYALKVAHYGLPLIGLGAVPYLFLNRNEKVENAGRAVVGIGMVFLGLCTMADGFKDPAVKEYLTQFFSTMSGEDYLGLLKCIVAAAVATEIVQSSSATLGIVIALAKSGVIPFETAAALVLGINVGTTITAVLAALRKGTSLEARRVAASHVMFNVIGAALLFPAGPRCIGAVKDALHSAGVNDVATQAAVFHTIFNVSAAALATAFIGPYEKLIRKILPDRLASEKGVVKHLSPQLMEGAPRMAAEASREEILEMGKQVSSMFSELEKVLRSDPSKIKNGRRIAGIEEDLDKVQAAIFEWLNQIAAQKIERDVAADIGAQRRLADQYETISDYLSDVFKRYLKMVDVSPQIDEKAGADIISVHLDVARYVGSVNSALAHGGSWTDAVAERKRIKERIRAAMHRHEERVGSGSGEGGISTYFMDIMHRYSDVLERAVNIAEISAEGKRARPRSG